MTHSETYVIKSKFGEKWEFFKNRFSNFYSQNCLKYILNWWVKKDMVKSNFGLRYEQQTGSEKQTSA